MVKRCRRLAMTDLVTPLKVKVLLNYKDVCQLRDKGYCCCWRCCCYCWDINAVFPNKNCWAYKNEFWIEEVFEKLQVESFEKWLNCKTFRLMIFQKVSLMYFFLSTQNFFFIIQRKLKCWNTQIVQFLSSILHIQAAKVCLLTWMNLNWI